MNVVTTSEKMVPLALNDTGHEVLMRRNEPGWGNMDRLETWDIAQSKIKKVLRSIPTTISKAASATSNGPAMSTTEN